MAILGIDLGTTNSLACVWRDGKPELVKNSLGELLTPSVVCLDENGSLTVGAVAREQLITNPENTASSFKRWMGTHKTFALGGPHLYPPGAFRPGAGKAPPGRRGGPGGACHRGGDQRPRLL